MNRKVCVVTATRAEYGLLKCLIDDIEVDKELSLQLVVTGSHLSPEFGYTVDQIRSDQMPISKTIEILLSSDSPVGVSKSMGLAQISFAEAFDELKPDIVVVLGDRFELLPIVSAANIARIPVAHLNGGEITEGAIDDIIRHSITKLSQLHFTAIDTYAKRVIQMGEQPDRVFNVGEVGLDNFKRMVFLNKSDFEDSINHKLADKNLMITYHPETTNTLEQIEKDFQIILDSLDHLENTLLIFTKANADVGGRAINNMIDDYVTKRSEKAISFMSLGQLRYLSALHYVDAIIGNSSSGIVEAPTFKVPSINIGNRQKGRIRAESVIDVLADENEIIQAINRTYTTEYKNILASVVNPYGQGESSTQVLNILKNINLASLQTKSFYDVSY
jgi:UDP-N-acetylglucosamine 2-epimerase (non-hydrolysing)|tara:strand:- start:2886 stop:4052 length:1167 start_codon:yes stop_codon:yes gene_type:complete